MADERIITPTDAGRLVPDRASLEQQLVTLEERLTSAYRSRVRTRLDDLGTRHEQAYERAVTEGLHGLQQDLEAAATGTIQGQLSTLAADLDAAYTGREQAIAHQQELASTERRYRLAIAGLVLLLLAVVVASFVL